MIQSEMDQYREAVRNYAKNKTPYLFHNRGNEHALIILSNLFINAESEIRIAAQKLFNEVVNSKEYIDSMKVFLDKKDTRLSILVSQIPSQTEICGVEKEKTLYWMLFTHPAYRQGRITIRNGNGSSFKDNKGESINFCTGDRIMFRLESDIKERKAVANYNDDIFTPQLIQAFDSIYQDQPLVDLNTFYAAC